MSSIKSIRNKILVLFAAVSAFCCIEYYSDLNQFEGYFNPDATGLKTEFRPFFYAPNSTFYDFYDSWYSDQPDDPKPEDDMHVKAWLAWLGNGFTAEEINRNLYQDTIPPAFLRKVRMKSKDGYEYLLFLQTANQLLHETDMAEWEEKPVLNLSSVETEWKRACDQSQKAIDPFLKERYSFMAVKLAWQLPDARLAINTYLQKIEPLSQKTYISDWARGRVATSYARNHQEDRALYEFAMLFENCPTCREDAVLSARLLHLTFSESVLTYTKNDKEKEAVFAFTGILPFRDNLLSAIRLASLNPLHPLLKLIVAREINRTEMYSSMKADPPTYFDSPEDSIRQLTAIENAEDYAGKLKNFVTGMAGNTMGSNQAFWLTAQSYLHHLQGENGTALTLIEKARRIPDPGEELSRQMAAQELLLLSLTETWMHPELEKRMLLLSEELQSDLSFYHTNARNKALLHFADLYEKGKDKGQKNHRWNWSCQNKAPTEIPAINLVKAFLVRAMTTSSQSNREWSYFSETSIEEHCNAMSARNMQSVMDLILKPDKPEVEKKLVDLSRITKDQISEWAARRYMAEHQYAKAAALFSQLPENSIEAGNTEPYTHFRNPFWVRMPFDTAANPLTPTQFAAEMAKLEARTKTAKGDDLAYAYYRLGCGEFNLSFEGTAWICVKASHSWYDPESLVPYREIQSKKPDASRLYLENDYITNEKALEYFEKSLNAAEDKNIKARSMYMAARCLMNRKMAETRIKLAATAKSEFGYYYTDSETWQQHMPALMATNKWIKSLQNFAPQTRFHQIMIRECSLYNDYFGENSESVFF